MDAWSIGGIAMGFTDKTVKDPGTSLFAILSDAIKVLAKSAGAMEVLLIPPFNKEHLIDEGSDLAEKCLDQNEGSDT